MSKKKNDAAKFVKQFFEENPEAMDLLTPQEDGMLFSKELRDVMEPFGDMDVRECLKSRDFLRALAKHGGITDDELNGIFKDK